MKPGRFLIITLVVLSLCIGWTLTAAGADPQTYTVRRGDTLWGISHKFYGNQNLWPKLWEMNRYNVTNPHQLTVGDVLIIYPLDQLMLAQAPPAPPPLKTGLYDRGLPLITHFPKYFTFVADPEGIGRTGVTRIKVKKTDPLTGKTIVTYDEVREVGEILASMERGFVGEDHGGDIHGKLLLAFNDDVIVRFTADLAKILDSATHEDPDPYFREFPIYGLGAPIREPDKSRHDFNTYVGSLHEYRGKLTIVSRVETLVPQTHAQRRRLATEGGRNRDVEPVSYVARITYSVKPVEIGDKVFLFKSIYPGPDRQTGENALHGADEYKPLGK